MSEEYLEDFEGLDDEYIPEQSSDASASYLEIPNPENEGQSIYIEASKALEKKLDSKQIYFEKVKNLPAGQDALDGVSADNFQEVMSKAFSDINAPQVKSPVENQTPDGKAPSPNAGSVEKPAQTEEVAPETDPKEEARLARLKASEEELSLNDDENAQSVEEAYYVNQELLLTDTGNLLRF